MMHREEQLSTSFELQQRAEFLRTMYSELWENINRHILVVWQPVAALFAAFAAMLLREAEFLQPDFGAALVTTAAAWVVAHAFDAASWFNRNLALVRNIEREFLYQRDIQNIHPFFARDHRKPKLVEHFRIQVGLAIAIWSITLGDHFRLRVWPGIETEGAFDILRSVPYALSIVFVFALVRLYRHYRKEHRKLTDASPGRAVRS